MSKKVPTLPTITSTFALLDVQKGRAPLKKVVGAGYRIPVHVFGYIQNGEGGVGHDDGVSREFSIDVESVVMRDPEFVPADSIGRPWALQDALAAGDKITLDSGFGYAEAHKPRKVKADTDGELYFNCECGEGRRQKHYLSGQLGKHGEYVGVYKVS